MSKRRYGLNNGFIGGTDTWQAHNGVISNAKNTLTRSDYLINPTAGTWVRPSDWLAMPTVSAGEQKIVILHSVYDTGTNFCSFRITCSTGNYTVDWGDGTSNTYASFAQAEKNYDYSTVTSAVTSRGYKTVLITITPVTGNITNFNFRDYPHSLSRNYTYSGGFLDMIVSAPNVSGVNPKLGGANIEGGVGTTVRMDKLERFSWIGTNGVTDWGYFFWACYNLQVVENLQVTSASTSCYGLFYECRSLRELKNVSFDTRNVTDFSYMFYNCYVLSQLPWLDTSKGTSFYAFAYQNYGVRHVPQYDLSKATRTDLMFYGCRSILEIPSFNCPLATRVDYMFSDMSQVKKIGKLITGLSLTNCDSLYRNCSSLLEFEGPTVTTNVTNMYRMFYACLSIIKIPYVYDTAKVTTFEEAFISNLSLLRGPTLDTSACTNFANMFNTCFSMADTPDYNTAAGTNFTGMFSGCRALVKPGGLTLTGAPTLTNMFNTCYSLREIPTIGISAGATPPSFASLTSLQKCGLTGIGQTVSFANCQMGFTALNSLYTSLATVGVSGAAAKTITVTNNWGTTGDNTMIAISKGWAVTG